MKLPWTEEVGDMIMSYILDEPSKKPKKAENVEKDNILTQEEISGVLSGKVSVAEILGLTEEEVNANMAQDEEDNISD